MCVVADTVQPVTSSYRGRLSHRPCLSHALCREGKEMFFQVSTGAWNTLTEGFSPSSSLLSVVPHVQRGRTDLGQQPGGSGFK